jgi:hypothetical protein
MLNPGSGSKLKPTNNKQHLVLQSPAYEYFNAKKTFLLKRLPSMIHPSHTQKSETTNHILNLKHEKIKVK